MDLYLIDYSSHFENLTSIYEPEVDRLINLSPFLEKIAINNEWIEDGGTIYSEIRNSLPKYKNSIQIKFVNNWTGTRRPVLIYDDKIISPIETKKSSNRPKSIYQFLTRGSNYHPPAIGDRINPTYVEKRLEKHFDVARLMAAAPLSKTNFISKGRRIRSHMPRRKLSKMLGFKTEETYKLTPIANLLRMGLDYSYFNYIIQTHPSSSIMPTLNKYFSETIHNQKNMDEIDVTKKGKYDFFGNTIYFDSPSREDLHNFHELVRPNTPNIPYHDSISLREEIINSYEKIKDCELFDLLTENENPTTIYAFLLPVKGPKSETRINPGYSTGKAHDRIHIAFAKNPKSMFHEIIESIAQELYSKRMGTIFANAASNVINDIGECGTKHTFSDNGDFDLDFHDIDDETNFNRAKKITKSLPHDQLKDFVISLLEATENTEYTNFNDADPYDILLPYRDGRLFNPDN